MDRDMESRVDAQFGTGPQTTGPSDAGLTADAKNKAKELVGNARDVAEQRLDTKKTQAADTLSGVARSLRSSTEQLYGAEAGAGQYVRQAADQVDRLAGFLQHRDVGEMMDQAEDFARRQPVLFIGAAFALGVAGAQFLKSSRERLDREFVGDRNYTEPDLARRDGFARPSASSYGDARPSDGMGYRARNTSPEYPAEAGLGYAAAPERADFSGDSMSDSPTRDLS